MKVKASRKASSTAIEYFLYAVIIIETAIAAFAYKVIGTAAELQANALTYLGLIYVGSLSWAFFQLNRLHRKRRKRSASANAAEALQPAAGMPMAAAATPSLALMRISTEADSRGGGDIEVGETVAAAEAPVLGLTRTQLAIVFLVFLAALKIFSWALTNVLRH